MERSLTLVIQVQEANIEATGKREARKVQRIRTLIMIMVMMNFGEELVGVGKSSIFGIHVKK